MSRVERQAQDLPTRRSSAPHPDPSSVALLDLQRQLAALVGNLMGVEGTWKTDPADAPGWWLSTWGRRLAIEHLEPPLATTVLTWLAATQELLNHGYTQHLDRRLLECAAVLQVQGADLTAEIHRQLPPDMVGS